MIRLDLGEKSEPEFLSRPRLQRRRKSGLIFSPHSRYMPKLYSELASWFHLLTAPKDYAEEAEFARKTLVDASSTPIKTLLELGAGGGNNAFHMKSAFAMTLTDLSQSML